MAKLYPPQLEGMLPAFYGNHLTIPFTMNSAVSASLDLGIAVRVKHAQNGNIIYSGTAGSIKESSGFNRKAEIMIPDSEIGNFISGNFYKIQIAYVNKDNNNEIGYYSSIGVIKYTNKPEVSVKIENGQIIGNYKNADATEKVYYYTFNIYDSNNNLLMTSGQQIHNSDNDSINESVDMFFMNTFPVLNENIEIEYKVITNNLLEETSSKTESIKETKYSFIDYLTTTLDYNNGAIELDITKNNSEDSINNYKLIKYCKDSNFKVWENVKKFTLTNSGESKKIIDFNLEQGLTYVYGIYPDNQDFIINIGSESLNEIKADYEDIFLFDSERQLRIRYNPKISSFKNSQLETKTNTIGSKYPFIFRNGQVGYKEFQISGLISYLSDENGYFIQNLNSLKQESYRNNTNSKVEDTEVFSLITNLTSENIKKEREFKQEVLNWLTNGKPKGFKSPVEGNYIVSLTAVSLSPNDTLGRMLHTFTCTASEIAEYNNENLIKFNIINIEV